MPTASLFSDWLPLPGVAGRRAATTCFAVGLEGARPHTTTNNHERPRTTTNDHARVVDKTAASAIFVWVSGTCGATLWTTEH